MNQNPNFHNMHTIMLGRNCQQGHKVCLHELSLLSCDTACDTLWRNPWRTAGCAASCLLSSCPKCGSSTVSEGLWASHNVSRDRERLALWMYLNPHEYIAFQELNESFGFYPWDIQSHKNISILTSKVSTLKMFSVLMTRFLWQEQKSQILMSS